MGNVVRKPWGGPVQAGGQGRGAEQKAAPGPVPERPRKGRPAPLVSSKVLVSIDEIKHFLRIGDILFEHFLKLKLPVVQINGRWFAHADNLEEWFKLLTSVQRRLDVPELQPPAKEGKWQK